MELKTKLYLVDAEGEKFMGIGVLWLLCEVEKGQSLRKAASTLGISYSKAFLMVRNLEKALGVSVLNRQKGGADRGGATLTTFGQQFLKLYDDFQKQAKLQVEKPFNDFSAGLSRLLESSEKIGEQEI